MLDKIYAKNLEDRLEEVERCTFPETLRFCRELMGIKQFACSEYLGFTQPRYKQIELGRFNEPLLDWEIQRLQAFFQLPSGMLGRKQKSYISGTEYDRRNVCQDVWNECESTRGERPKRSQEDYSRVRGVLE